MAKLVDIDELKILMGITGTDDDEKLDILITAAEEFVENIIGYPLDGEAVEEDLIGDGTDNLMLDRFPVTALTEVTVDSVALVLTGDTQQVMAERGGFIKRVDGGVFTMSRLPNVHVECMVRAVGKDMALAIMDLVDFKYNQSEKGMAGKQSETMGSYSYTAADTQDIPGFAGTIKRYKNPVAMVK